MNFGKMTYQHEHLVEYMRNSFICCLTVPRRSIDLTNLFYWSNGRYNRLEKLLPYPVLIAVRLCKIGTKTLLPKIG